MEYSLVRSLVGATSPSLRCRKGRKMTIKTYSSYEEMLAQLQADRAAADALVGPEAAQYKMGGHYARFHPSGLIIYGELLDPIQEEKDAGADEDEVEFQRQLRAQPHMKNYFYTKSYSRAPGCKDGEYGDVHVSAMNLPLTKEEFERARELGWPVDPKVFFEEVLKVQRVGGEMPSA